MTSTFAKYGTLTALLFSVQACGGGGSVPVEPISSAGFADGVNGIGNQDSFNVDSVTRQRALEAGVPVLQKENVAISIGESGGPVTIVLSEGEFELAEQGGGLYRFEDASRRVFLQREIVPSNQVETVFVGYADDNGPNSAGFVTFGFDTDPSTISMMTGSTRYTGDVEWVVDGTSRFGFANGNFNLVANFENSEVFGNFTMEDDGDPRGGLTIPLTNFIVSQANLTQNSFSGTLSADIDGSAFTGVQVGDSRVQGRIYGVDADAIGGEISIELENSSGNPSFAVQGGFAGLK